MPWKKFAKGIYRITQERFECGSYVFIQIFCCKTTQRPLATCDNQSGGGTCWENLYPSPWNFKNIGIIACGECSNSQLWGTQPIVMNCSAEGLLPLHSGMCKKEVNTTHTSSSSVRQHWAICCIITGHSCLSLCTQLPVSAVWESKGATQLSMEKE